MSKKELREAAEEATQTTADRAAQVLNELSDVISPLIADAQQKVAPLAKDAQARLAEAEVKVAPVLATAKEQVATTYEQSVRPKLAELWDKAQENEHVAEAQDRGVAALAALKGENYLPRPAEPVNHFQPEKPRKHIAAKIFKGLGIAAVVAGFALALRQLLLPKDDGWTPHEPSHAYIPDEETEAEAVFAPEASPVTTVDDEAPGEATDQTDKADSVASEINDKPLRYGEGSYVGDNPPEGYTIKGNERSMKFHVSGGAGYERTIADVWFNSEDAAEKAGFTRASR